MHLKMFNRSKSHSRRCGPISSRRRPRPARRRCSRTSGDGETRARAAHGRAFLLVIGCDAWQPACRQTDRRPCSPASACVDEAHKHAGGLCRQTQFRSRPSASRLCRSVWPGADARACGAERRRPLGGMHRAFSVFVHSPIRRRLVCRRGSPACRWHHWPAPLCQARVRRSAGRFYCV